MMKNEDVIKVGKSDIEEDDVTIIDWKDSKMHYLIVIQGEINKESTKRINKQSKKFQNVG